MIVKIFLLIASFIMMEFVAWFTHKYIMHGFLWFLHQDHHIRTGKKIEKNDWFAVIFAVPGIVLTILGTLPVVNLMFFIGLGISLYGLFYFLFHDIYVHQRIPLFKNFSNRYLRATLRAHLDHHQPHSNKNYGFLIAPMSYYLQEFKRNTPK